ncbi:MAG TPA: hypothetical protein VEY30_04045, partial [Myxococcaceae bacterium]|nr:hypothetical protein [Myxococcaceae bacterium]
WIGDELLDESENLGLALLLPGRMRHPTREGGHVTQRAPVLEVQLYSGGWAGLGNPTGQILTCLLSLVGGNHDGKDRPLGQRSTPRRGSMGLGGWVGGHRTSPYRT